MIAEILFYAHSTLLLIFGLVLSFAFTGAKPTKNACLTGIAAFAFTGVLQLTVLLLYGETLTRELYPLITHLPLLLVLCIGLKKRMATCIAAVASAYLCCQPAKWFGLLLLYFTDSQIAAYVSQIIVLLLSGIVSLLYLAPFIAEIYNKDTRSILIFGSIPAVYYIFDYAMGIYTDFLAENNQLATEFLPFILCFAFMALCAVYYKEYEQKADAERKEQIIRITAEQQAKEVNAIRQSNLETRILRHDMRHLLDSLALSIENDDKDSALRMIRGYAEQIESAALRRFCENDTVNYILSGFDSKCEEMNVDFEISVETDFFTADEVMFASILSNALENALNAQTELPPASRSIRASIVLHNSKLLLSVKNSFKTAPVFVDGMPVSQKKGHGYGTQSIRYLSEKLGGKCQFSLQDDVFITRVII